MPVGPRISAVVVTHAGGRLLDECLASLSRQSRKADETLVVVSNHRLPVTGAPALQLHTNVGYARAANAGARETTGEILLLNDDTRLDPGCIAALAGAWQGPGVYQPRIRLADGSGRLDNIGHGFFPDGAVWARGRNGPDATSLPGAPGGFSGAAVLIARSTWNALGGFDERYGSFGEDVDLSLRLLRRGVDVRPVPEALVEHHLGATWGRVSPEKLRLIERNRVRAAVRSLPLSALAAMPVATAARYAAFAGLAAVGRGPGEKVSLVAQLSALRGMVEGALDAPTYWRERRADASDWSLGEWAMLGRLWTARARWRDVSR